MQSHALVRTAPTRPPGCISSRNARNASALRAHEVAVEHFLSVLIAHGPRECAREVCECKQAALRLDRGG
jgi:hypothetical protein